MFKVSDEEKENLKQLCLMVKHWQVEVATLSEEQAEAFRELNEYFEEEYFNV